MRVVRMAGEGGKPLSNSSVVGILKYGTSKFASPVRGHFDQNLVLVPTEENWNENGDYDRIVINNRF